MKKTYVKAMIDDKVICERCEIANNPVTRFMGLMFRKGLGDSCGLMLEPCNEIHTFNMRFSIDVLTLSRDNEILAKQVGELLEHNRELSARIEQLESHSSRSFWSRFWGQK